MASGTLCAVRLALRTSLSACRRVVRRRTGAIVVALVALVGGPPAWSQAVDVRAAIARDDCPAVGEAINQGLARKDAEAFFFAGFIYDHARCVDADPARAARLYRQAIALGNVDAPAFLGLLVGLGRGVPQDYAAAHRIFHGDKPADCDAAATPDALTAMGYAETLARLAVRRVSYPVSANSTGIEAAMDVVLTPDRGAIEFAHVHVDPEVGSRIPRTRDFADPIEAAYRDTIAEAPRPVLGTDGAALRVVTPWRFALPRDAQNRKVRLEGAVTVGDACPVR